MRSFRRKGEFDVARTDVAWSGAGLRLQTKLTGWFKKVLIPLKQKPQAELDLTGGIDCVAERSR